MVKDIEELEESVDESAVDLAEVSGGIFDEDIEDDDEDKPVAGIFDEDVELFDEDEPVSNFDIGNTMLTAAMPVESWAGQNLEETLSRDWVKKDWEDDEDAFSGDFYKSSGDKSDVYGSGSDVYSSGRGNGVYNESSGAYDAEKGGAYDVKGADVGGLKSHDQIRDDQRGGSSILDFVGRDDKNKQKSSDFKRDFVTYEARDAA